MLKSLIKLLRLYNKNQKGNASIEYVLILSIIVTIVFTLFTISLNVKGVINSSTCEISCTVVESEYKNYLQQRGNAHSETMYSQFFQEYGSEVCPENNIVTYVNGNLRCSVHSNEKNNIEDDQKENDDPVPFL